MRQATSRSDAKKRNGRLAVECLEPRHVLSGMSPVMAPGHSGHGPSDSAGGGDYHSGRGHAYGHEVSRGSEHDNGARGQGGFQASSSGETYGGDGGSAGPASPKGNYQSGPSMPALSTPSFRMPAGGPAPVESVSAYPIEAPYQITAPAVHALSSAFSRLALDQEPLISTLTVAEGLLDSGVGELIATAQGGDEAAALSTASSVARGNPTGLAPVSPVAQQFAPARGALATASEITGVVSARSDLTPVEAKATAVGTAKASGNITPARYFAGISTVATDSEALAWAGLLRDRGETAAAMAVLPLDVSAVNQAMQTVLNELGAVRGNVARMWEGAPVAQKAAEGVAVAAALMAGQQWLSRRRRKLDAIVDEATSSWLFTRMQPTPLTIE